MKKYHYLVTFFYEKDEKLKPGSIELEIVSRVAFYSQLDELAKIIKQKENLDHYPVIWGYKLLRTEVIE